MERQFQTLVERHGKVQFSHWFGSENYKYVSNMIQDFFCAAVCNISCTWCLLSWALDMFAWGLNNGLMQRIACLYKRNELARVTFQISI